MRLYIEILVACIFIASAYSFTYMALDKQEKTYRSLLRDYKLVTKFEELHAISKDENIRLVYKNIVGDSDNKQKLVKNRLMQENERLLVKNQSDNKNILASCLMSASERYSVPPAILFGIYKVVNGKSGEVYHENYEWKTKTRILNVSGTYLGLNKVNSYFLPELAKEWFISEDEAYRRIRDNDCSNFNALGFILKRTGEFEQFGSVARALGSYYDTSHYRTQINSTPRDLLSRVSDELYSADFLKSYYVEDLDFNTGFLLYINFDTL